MKKNIIALTISALLILCAVFFLLVKLSITDKKDSLVTLANSNAKTAVLKLLPQINKALENSDDIELIDITGNIVQTDNISLSFITDQTGKILVSSNLTGQTDSSQAATRDGDIIYSIPAAKGATLHYAVSLKITEELMRKWQIRYYTIAALAVLLIIFIFYVLAKFFILRPYNRIKKTLEDKSAADGNYNELTDIVESGNKKSEDIIKNLTENNTSLADAAEFLTGTKNENSQAFIILNSKNDIITAFDKTGKFLKEGVSKGSNILEAAKNKVIFDILNSTQENPNHEADAVFEDFIVTSFAVEKDKQISATIIKIAGK